MLTGAGADKVLTTDASGVASWQTPAGGGIASGLDCIDCIGPTEITDSYVLNTGDAMTGALAMGNNKITGLATPTADTDAATKAYVDAAGGIVYEVCCAWRYDYREGSVGTGAATNWSCTPPSCYSGYTSLGISTIPSGVSCAGGTSCNFSDTDYGYHPVSVGRSCRVCAQ